MVVISEVGVEFDDVGMVEVVEYFKLKGQLGLHAVLFYH
jgi:hypothetical protein